MEQRSHVLRRFVLLGGENYYAKGGFQDFHSSHDTLEDAVACARAAENAQKYGDEIQWWQVWDCQTNAVVAVSDEPAFGANDPWPKLDEPTEMKPAVADVISHAEPKGEGHASGQIPGCLVDHDPYRPEPPEVK